MESQWLANHLLVLADGRELVLRRWARPGWEVDDPDLTAAREALVLARLADTPVPAPELVAADPDAAARATSPRCCSPACRARRSMGARRSGRSSTRWPTIHAVDPAGVPPYRRYYEPDRLAVPTWAADREVWERAIALAHAPPPDAPRALHPPRLPSGQHAVGGRRAHGHRRLDHRLARPGGGRPRPPALEPRRSTTASASPTPSSPTPSTIPTTTSSPRSTSCPSSTPASRTPSCCASRSTWRGRSTRGEPYRRLRRAVRVTHEGRLNGRPSRET